MPFETSELAGIGPGWQRLTAADLSALSPDSMELMLAAASLDDVVRLLDGIPGDHDAAGALTARLVELGGHPRKEGDGDQGQLYADAMRLQKQRLEQNAGGRHALAMHPRTYGRPTWQLVTEADDWVAPMVEAEIELLSADDLARLRHHLIMRIGRQHDIHADYRPLLLSMTTDDRTLQCLASIEQGLVPFERDHADRSGPNKSFLLAAVAGPFIDVVMNDADDGIELEAAAWDFAQRRLAETTAFGGSRHLIRAVRETSSLLALIDTSRALAARQSQAQAHAGLATRSAVAEFILSNLMLLASNPKAALAGGRLNIGSFVRRDDVGRSPLDIPDRALEAWIARRSSRRLLLDLALLTLLADHERHDLPPMPAASGDDIIHEACRHLATIEAQTIAKMAVQAINDGWYATDWAA